MIASRHIYILFAIIYFLSFARYATALEIRFSAQLKTRGTYRDTSWWDKNTSDTPSRRGVYSNFWDTNLTSFLLARRNQEQNNPLSETQPYNDQNIAGRNLYGNDYGKRNLPTNGNSAASWLDSRALLGIQAIINENLKGVFLLQFGQYDWGSYATSVGTNNEPLLVNNAYVEFNSGSDYNIVAGIAPIKIGHGVLLQDDMALLETSISSKYGRFMLFAATAAENFRTKNDDDDYYGGSLGIEFEQGYVEMFTVWQRSIGVGILLDSTMANFGLSGDLKFDIISVSFEGIWQQGRFRTELSRGLIELNAFLGYLDVSLDIGAAKAGLSGLYASGNKNDYETALNNDLNMFYAISPTDSYDRCILNWDELFVREILTNNVSNIISPKWYVTYTALDNVSITLQNQWYWKSNTPEGDGRFIGKNVDVIVDINIYDQLAWRVTGSYMWTEYSDDIWQLRQALTYTF